jgi:hypothetical protein
MTAHASSAVRGRPDGPLIAFVHIPKTAGGTATNMLAGAYSRAAVRDAGNFMRDPDRSAKKVTRRPGGWERWQRKGGRVTVGHLPYGLFREHLPTDTRYITLLRKPVDRVLSHYHGHLRLTGTPRDQRKLERGLVLAASVEDALRMRLPELTNLATRFLCGNPSPMGELPVDALDDAKANLREFAFVGIQERFEESVVLLQRTFSLGLVPYVNRHVSMDRPTVDAIPDEQRALIEEHNRLDAELYSFAQELFEDAVAAADDGFAADVEKLRALSADADRAAIENARDWLDRELPPGSSKPKAALFAAADAAGVSAAALKRVSTQSSVQREPDHTGQMIWTRTNEIV